MPGVESRLKAASSNRVRARVCAYGALLCACMVPAMRVPGAEMALATACKVRIILGLAQAMRSPPDDKWVQDLAVANGVELHYLRPITPDLYLFRMSAPDSDGGCGAAIWRLRRDSRLRSAEIEQRRGHDAG
jgi:hypothetical protein